MARQNLDMSKAYNKQHYDQYVHVPKFKIGKQVLVKDESVRRGRSKKLEAPYVGLYEIMGIEGPNLLLRTRRSKTLKIHANRAKLFFCLITDVDAIRKHIEFTVAFCVKHSKLWQCNATVCNSMLDVVYKDYERVQEMKEPVLQLIRTERGIHRQKRGIFNIVGR